MNTGDIKYVQAIFQLHRFIAAGEGDSPEADELRNKMDFLHENRSVSDDFFRLISIYCYGLSSEKDDEDCVKILEKDNSNSKNIEDFLKADN